ncbi:eukaryotic translation initiation factor 5B [Cotesia typhae]|uniref:eukaryotic translation initiation factor 5B n=1 Tax=Cotesia typhae TaxID=2053667 RepID=UPI003D6823CF
MGKAKKGKRSGKDNDMDSDVDIDEQSVASQDSKTKSSKLSVKDKKKKKDEIDDLADDLEELKVDKSKNKKGKKSNRKAYEDSGDELISLSSKNVQKGKDKKDNEDIDSDYEVKGSKGKKKNQIKKGFAALNLDSDNDNDEDNDNDDEEKVTAKPKGKTKKKKGKKENDFDDFDDDENERVNIKLDEDDGDDSLTSAAKNKVNNKKNKKKKDDDFDDDNTKVKGKTKKGKKKSSSDDEDDIVSKSSKNKPVTSVFALLNVEGEDDDDDRDDDDDDDDKRSQSEDEEKVVSKERPKGKQQNTKNQNQESAQNKKGKKGKKKNDSDDEIERVLAELEMEYSGNKKVEAKPVQDDTKTEEDKDGKDEGEDKDDDKKKKKKKNKAKGKDDKEKDQEISTKVEESKVVADDEKGDDESGTVKTAAQKKKEKKEREKAKKLAQKKGEQPKKPQAESEQPDAESSQPAEADEELDDDSKKKKKSKEDSKDKGKGLSKKTLAQMQAALKQLKEDEERAKREEEERIRQEEIREQLRLKQLQEEQERKERKKLKEKQRKERLKAEGKLLTPKQKQERARAQAMLDALKAQGHEVPDKGDKKARRPPLGSRPRLNKLKQSSQDNKTDNDKQQDDNNKIQQVKDDDKESSKNSNEQVQLEIVDLPAKVSEDVGEIKDSWDVDSSENDEDDKSEETKEQKSGKVDIKSTKTVSSKKAESEESEESSESDESDDDNESDDSSDSSDDNEDSIDDKMTDAEKKRERVKMRIANKRIEAEKKKTIDNLRAAVVCVLGHVDTGKTKILDKLRRTNVQDGEAGGITQQIGATNVPIDAIIDSTKHVKGIADKKFKLPGLLIIDTPGHESFSNLRNRGSSLCDIAILVVDIMHGLEPQTVESIGLLKEKKCPFVVALNKIDRLYDWQTMNRKDIQDIIKSQTQNTQLEFERRTNEVIGQFAEKGLNAALFYKNPDPRNYVSLVPTSAITGEGMGNLLSLIVEFSQGPLAKRLMYSEELQAIVLEVKVLPGLGTTIDCILVNGSLREGDTMIVAGTDGPIVTQIRSLLMPQPLKELRVKNAYIEYREIKAAQGVKIAAKDLEKAIAGLNLLVAQKPDEVDLLKEEIARELSKALGNIKLAERGVFVHASTLGALEALLDFLKTSKIPYAGIRIGPVVKKDVIKASIMLEHNSQYATILAFDVKIERDAQELADSLGVKIFQADIIYHLFDKFIAYREELKQRRREEFKHIAVFPCKFRVLPQHIFNSRDPIVVGVMVEAGVIREGTPVCVPSKEFIDLGVVTSIEYNHKDVETARKGQEVCVKIEPIPGEAPKMYGRHFDDKDIIVSKISRQSIDACKDYFRDDLLKSDWQVMLELKKLFEIL